MRTSRTAISACAHDPPRGLLTRGMGEEHGRRVPLRARLKSLTELSFPERFPIVQFPNAPLAVALVAAAAADHLNEPVHAYVRSVSYLAMAVWAYEELTAGVNWFRRLLGLVFLAVTVVNVARLIYR